MSVQFHDSDVATSRQRLTILDLPQDVHAIIFEFRDVRPVDRLAYGLTCHMALQIVKDWRGHVPVPQMLTVRLDPRPSDDAGCANYKEYHNRVRNTIKRLNRNSWKDLNYFWGRNPRGTFSNDINTFMRFRGAGHWLVTYRLWTRRSSRIDYCEPEPLYPCQGYGGIIRQLSTLVATFLMDPWLFLTPGLDRRCIGCPKTVPTAEASSYSQRHELGFDGVILEFFTCADYPGCYRVGDRRCQQSYVRRLQEGDLPATGTECCRLYWRSQANIKEA